MLQRYDLFADDDHEVHEHPHEDGKYVRAADAAKLEETYRREREAHAANLKQQQKCEAELADLTAKLNAAEERSKACDQIAEGDEGWEVLRNLCMSTMSVASLRDEYEQFREALHSIECPGDGATKLPCCIAAEALGNAHIHADSDERAR